jgi:deoxycytidylate deaminase
MGNALATGAVVRTEQSAKDSRTAVLEHAANELVVAVVGHVGSGTSTVADALQRLLESAGLAGGRYDVVILKARDVIQAWAEASSRQIPTTGRHDLEAVEAFQDLGDEMRYTTKDNAAVAKGLIGRIRRTRAEKTGVGDPGDAPVKPDGKKRTYILDSIRHPAEVDLLRHVYQDAFVLIGVVCEEERRLSRVMRKYDNAGEAKAKKFMRRDAKALQKHGQRVSDAFHLSDFFLDNTVERFEKSGAESAFWDINEKLSRLIKIISHLEIVRPETSETAMHHAHGAAMRSACLSRQVGAALVDVNGNVIATGTNEVPQAGGGVYGESFDEDAEDHRCAYRKTGTTAYCSNTRQQNELVDRLIDEIPELKALDAIRRNALREEIRRGGVGDLLEFSRAVHAEMDAVLSAGREGTSTIGTRLFVTTFPCHYCARHIVSAGVDEVQFIEPYPKSLALGLHADAIQLEATEWKPPSAGGTKVLFRPFVGVAPRLYRRAFFKDRDLKNPLTGDLDVGTPEWGTPWHLRTAGYVELEAALIKASA